MKNMNVETYPKLSQGLNIYIVNKQDLESDVFSLFCLHFLKYIFHVNADVTLRYVYVKLSPTFRNLDFCFICLIRLAFDKAPCNSFSASSSLKGTADRSSTGSFKSSTNVTFHHTQPTL